MTATGTMDCLSVAHRLADAARPIALHYFRSPGLGTDNKASEGDGFDPVTLADRAIERAMRDILAEDRPDDGILGEEYDDVPSRTGVTWVLDPIDGTRAFLCGLPSWGVLIAANDGEKPVIGVMDQPFIGERFTGTLLPEARNAVLDNRAGTRELAVRGTEALSEALMCSTAPDMFRGSEAHAFASLGERVRLTRFGTDCYAYALLAMGQIDLVVESSLKPYDIQALMPLVQAAGGIVTNWSGGDAQQGGQVIAAATPALHEAAMSVLNGA